LYHKSSYLIVTIRVLMTEVTVPQINRVSAGGCVV
jgi:hypothetical protein